MHNFKTFDSFGQGAQELRRLVSPYMDVYLGDKAYPSEDEVIKILLKITSENIPSLLNPEYPAVVALSVGANEVGFKTRGFFSFGWRTSIGDDGKIIYQFRITFNGRNKNKFITNEKVLAENNWRQVEIHRKNKDVKKSKQQVTGFNSDKVTESQE